MFAEARPGKLQQPLTWQCGCAKCHKTQNPEEELQAINGCPEAENWSAPGTKPLGGDLIPNSHP